MGGIKGKSGNKNFGLITNTGKTRFKKGHKPWNVGVNMWEGREHPKGRYIDGRSYNKSPNRYGDDWEKIRQLIYKRDGYVCQKCGKHKLLDVHHIIPFMDSFDNSLNNLISLCRSCHMKEEAKIIKTMKGGKRNMKILKNKK